LNFINHDVFTHDLRQQVIRLNKYCNQFRTANNVQAIWEICITLTCLAVIYTSILAVMPYSTLAAVLLGIPGGAFLTRLFALQHDCGHGSFFTSTAANDWAGRFISILTFTPYDHWRRSHAYHHSHSGNLEGRGLGDIETITTDEYDSLRPRDQLKYRLFRNPLIVLCIGPIVYFFMLQRMAFVSYGETLPLKVRLMSILPLDAVLLAVYGGLVWTIGLTTSLVLVVPSAFVAAWVGGWLFYVQHQFEETHWEHEDEWDVKSAALLGSSFLILPRWLDWLTCNISHHHIHHLISKIPSYRLPECLAGNLELQTVAPRLTLWQALRTSHLALWDKKTRRLISFKEHELRRAVPEAVVVPAE
jgi:acyl-lipid omega-6 desaturase (Delta-12 desaturase)